MGNTTVNLEELTQTPKPESAEGVIKFDTTYYWYNFTKREYYSRNYQRWYYDDIPEPNKLIVDFREWDNSSTIEETKAPENSGLSCNYYVVDIKQPTSVGTPYTAECNDIIEALGMNATEANIFKEIWRTAAARTLGKEKAGHNAKRGAEKTAFFGLRYAFQNGVSYDDMMKTLKDMKVNVQ